MSELRTLVRLGILASGAGTTLRSIACACESGQLPAEVAVVISNNSAAGALGVARSFDIPGVHISRNTHGDDVQSEIARTLALHRVDLVLLAGYLKRIGRLVLELYPGRILNVHPALLPAFGGQGMYGRRVHEAVLASGARTTGATIHLVDGEYDTGRVLAREEVPISPGETVGSLETKVQAVERALYVETLRRLLDPSSGLALPPRVDLK